MKIIIKKTINIILSSVFSFMISWLPLIILDYVIIYFNLKRQNFSMRV